MIGKLSRIFLSLTLIVFCLEGCAPRVGTVANTPPGVTQPQVQNWYAATGAFTKIADVDHQILAGVVGFHDSGLWSDTGSYEISLRALGRIEQIQIEAATFLKTVPDDWSKSTREKIQTYTNEMSAEIQKVNASGATGIKNPDSLATINALIADLTKTANLVLTLVNAFTPQTANP